jgi:hypothetical protein
MKTTAFVLPVAVAIACGALGQNVVYQQAGVIGAVSVSGPIVSPGFRVGRAVTGSPFSATEQRHSLQVLGDGTHIEQTESSQISRDAEGRTRTEADPGGSDAPAMATIQDPVAGTTYFLDPVNKTANKLPLPKVLNSVGLPASVTVSSTVATFGADTAKVMAFRAGPGVSKSEAATPAPIDEDLGAQEVNGVLAKGTRTTINIPVGQIGNDRALQVVNERWYSDELGMIVKSSNSDPRFGTTTYELVNISRVAPDPSLFQIPADYTVNEEKAMFKRTN